MKNRNLARVLALVLVLCMGVMMLSACQKAVSYTHLTLPTT